MPIQYCMGVFYASAAVKDHFACHVRYYVVFGLVAVIGIIIGITGANSLGVLATSADFKILIFKQVNINGSGIFGLLGKNMLILIISCSVVLAVNISAYFLPLGLVFVLYRGYVLGFNTLVIIKVYGTGGIFNVIIVYIPFQLVMLLCVLAASGICARRCIHNSRFGAFVIRGVDYPVVFRSLGVVIAVGFAVSLGFAIIASVFLQGMVFIF